MSAPRRGLEAAVEAMRFVTCPRHASSGRPVGHIDRCTDCEVAQLTAALPELLAAVVAEMPMPVGQPEQLSIGGRLVNRVDFERALTRAAHRLTSPFTSTE